MNTERGTRWELRRSRRAMTSIALLSAAFAGAKIQDIVRGVIHGRRARGRGADGATVAGADFPSGDSAADAAPAAPLSPPRPALTKLTRKSIGSPNAAATKQSVEEEVVVCSVCHQGVGTPSSPVTPLSHHRGPPSTPGSNTTTVNSHSGFRGVPAPKPDPYAPKPRDRYLKWDDYFMSVAFLSAQRSKDPNKQVGAVIVGPDRVIMGVGYNGFPRGCSDSDLPWAKKSTNGNPMETKYAYVCHAEMNAIMNKNAQSLRGATLYVTMYPCNECAKLIIQSGITEVVYFEGKNVEPADAAGGSSDAGGGGVSSAANGGPSSPRKELAAASGWRELEVGVTPGKAEPRTPTATRKGEETETNDRRGDEFSSLEHADAVGAEKPETPTKGGVRPNPAYFAAGKLLALANVKVRQHTPRATVGVTYR